MSEIHRCLSGAYARFSAGAALTDLHLTPLLRLSDQISVSVDTASLAVNINDLTNKHLRCVAGLVKLSLCESTAGPMALKRVKRETLARYASAAQTWEAVRHLTALGFAARIVYVVHVTAPRQVVDAARQRIQWYLQSYDGGMRARWYYAKSGPNSKDDLVTLRVSSESQKNMSAIKELIERLYRGGLLQRDVHVDDEVREVELWDPFFETAGGDAFLRDVGRDAGVVVLADREAQLIRIPGLHNNKVLEPVIKKIEEMMDSLRQATKVEFRVSLDKTMFHRLVKGGLKEAEKIVGAGNAKLKIEGSSRVMFFTCAEESARRVCKQLGLPSPTAGHQGCAICDTADPPVQLSCGHGYCKDCFDMQMHVASTARDKRFPTLCYHPSCNKAIILPDLRRYLTPSQFTSLLSASIIQHRITFQKSLRPCRKPDCPDICAITTTPILHTCQACLTTTCTHCGTEPHPDWTCEEHTQHRDNTIRDPMQLAAYKRETDTRDCPNCHTLIEKDGGCNHVKCPGCYKHLCWKCMAVFDESHEVYMHLGDADLGEIIPRVNIEWPRGNYRGGWGGH